GVTGTFTQSGSNGINTGGGGTVTPPTSLHSVHIVNIGGAFPGADYTVNLTGTQSGTFHITGGSVGDGTFTYSSTSSGAVLILNYTSEGAIGDRDTMNMTFSTATAGTFNGSQLTGNQEHTDFSGTFDSAN
ncbi:MAG: hypothetical protein JWM99_2452, partial [Verrucomicrobiales bacterium]|nr:hypothetical protein [Verrucomicrobiales bacterium]